MEPTPTFLPTPPVTSSCSESCHYAQNLQAEYIDWIWCTRPGAITRTVPVGHDCGWFTTVGPSSADSGAKPPAD